jgi:amino acid transporter
MAQREFTTKTVPQADFEAADRHLRKSMGFNGILFMSIGAIIGSGWLLAANAAASVAGPAAIISWVIGGIFIIFVAFSYAEIAGMLPRTGAIVRYPQLTHGAYTGWLVGWTYWLSAICVPAIEAEAVLAYLGGRFPGSGLIYTSHGVAGLLSWPRGIGAGVGLMLLFFCLNVFGIRLLSEWNRVFTWWKLVIPIATFCFLFLVFRGTNLTAYHGFFATGTGNMFQALSTTGIVFAYLGFRQALDYAGESRRPQRDVPLATILSVVITMCIYALLQVGFLGALSWHGTGVAPGNWAGLATGHWATTPLYSAMTAAGIGAMLSFAPLLLVDAGISPSGTGWIYMGTSIRTNYGLAVHGYGPKALQTHNRWGIPWVSAIIAFVVGCVFFIPAPSWFTLVGFITSTTVLTYIMCGLGLPIFRKYAPNLPRPYRQPMAWLWAPVGFLAAMMIVYWAGFKTLSSVYAAVFVGLPLFSWYYLVRRGWVRNRWLAYAHGLVFLGGWVFLNRMGGWVFVPVPPSAGSWPFGSYDIALSAAVIFYTAGIGLLGNAEARKHITRGLWFIWMLLAVFPLSYYGQFGASKTPAIPFPWDTLIAVGIGLVAYYWGVASGFYTDELREIVEGAGPAGESVEPYPTEPAQGPSPAAGQ